MKIFKKTSSSCKHKDANCLCKFTVKKSLSDIDFDISLCVKIFNITNIHRTASGECKSITKDIAAIKDNRNYVAHANAQCKSCVFEKIWADVEMALLSQPKM